MVNKLLNYKLFFIILHIAFGFIGTLPFFPKIFGLICLIIPIYYIVISNNNNEEAFLFSSYLVGAEVFIRMTKGFILYETGKYGVLLFLLMGIVFGNFKQKFSPHFIFYILLLLLGIIFTEVPEGESIRKNIVFNLSGPVLLGVSAIYFYQRPINIEKLLDALFFMVLPLFSTISYLYFRTPDLEEIVFGGQANFATSGGFGPNQVATAIGLGMFIISVFLFLKKQLSGYLILDALFLIYFSYRGLLTFSRGGIITAAFAILLFSFFFILYRKISFQIIFKYILIISFFTFSVWIYTSNITGGMLNNRYTGKNAIGVQKDITTGRFNLLETQFSSFIENPLGIGVGNGKFERQKQLNGVTAASHNEVGRLLEEHGIVGFILLIMLMFMPLFNFIRSNYFCKAFIIGFYILWFLTINHSAMRIAFPGFIYALSLIRIVEDEY